MCILSMGSDSGHQEFPNVLQRYFLNAPTLKLQSQRLNAFVYRLTCHLHATYCHILPLTGFKCFCIYRLKCSKAISGWVKGIKDACSTVNIFNGCFFFFSFISFYLFCLFLGLNAQKLYVGWMGMGWTSERTSARNT